MFVGNRVKQYAIVLLCLIVLLYLCLLAHLMRQSTFLPWLYGNYFSFVTSKAEIESRLQGPISWYHPKLISVVRKSFLDDPSSSEYNLTEDAAINEDYLAYKLINPSWVYIDRTLGHLFKNKSSGFFVEAGALDGEFLSNTLSLEKRGNWQGLLIEADQMSYKVLKSKHRKAWSSPACLSERPFPYEQAFSSFISINHKDVYSELIKKGGSRVASTKNGTEMSSGGYTDFSTAQCLPLQSLLLALNVTKVDLISLDVEGAEKGIIQSFPFNEISVDAWVIEHVFVIRNLTKHGALVQDGRVTYEDVDFVEFFEKRGYFFFDMVCSWIPDYIFIKKQSQLFHNLPFTLKHSERRNLCIDQDIHSIRTTIFEIQNLVDKKFQQH